MCAGGACPPNAVPLNMLIDALFVFGVPTACHFVGKKYAKA